MNAADWIQFGVNILMFGVLVWTAWITFKSQKLQNKTAIFEQELEQFKSAPKIDILNASIIHFGSPRVSRFDFNYENTGNTVAYITKIHILSWIDKNSSPETFPTWPSEFLLKPNEHQTLFCPLKAFGKAKECYYFKITFSYYQRFLGKKHNYESSFYYVAEKSIFEVETIHDQVESRRFPLLLVPGEEIDHICTQANTNY